MIEKQRIRQSIREFLLITIFLPLVIFSHYFTTMVHASVLIVAQDGSGDFDTIQAAATVAQPGDTVLIRTGIYNELIEPFNSGTSEEWILYRKYAEDEVVIYGGGGDRDCCIKVENNSYIGFSGLTLRGALYAGFYAEGPVDHVIIDSCVVEDMIHPDYGVGYGIWFMAWEAPISECTISNCTIRNNSSHGIFLYRRNYDILIHGNEVSYSGIDDDDWGHNVKTVVWHEDDPYTGPRRITITDNILHHARTQGIMTWNARDLLIRGNHCHHNGATGIQIEDGTKYFVVEENLCEWNQQNYSTEAGIWIDDADYGVVQRNIIRHNQVGIKVSKSRDIIVRRNLVYKNSRENTEHAHNGGIFLLAYDAVNNEDIIIVHNTFSEIGNPVYSNACIGLYEYYGAEIRSALFKNNIISETRSGYELSMQALDASSAFNSNCNNIHNSDGIVINWQETDMTWQEYQDASEQDTGSITTWPAYVDTSLNDYHLDSSSPCIDTGGALTVTTGAGTGTVISLNDVRFFSDGFNLISGDSVLIGANPPVEIIAVDPELNRIIVSTPLAWYSEDPVHYQYYGSSPDIGALEAMDPCLQVVTELFQGMLILRWTPVSGTTGYSIYGAENNPVFVPGDEPDYEYHLAQLPPWVTTWSSEAGIGDPLRNWTYVVRAVDWSNQPVADSHHVGELDFGNDISLEYPHD